MTHTDIVPPGEVSLWKGNPYKAWIEKGRIYGRGVEDNQQDLVASLFAVKAFQAEGLLPAYDIGIALVADEETGSKKGIDYVLEHSRRLPEAGPHHRSRRGQRVTGRSSRSPRRASSGSRSRPSASRPTARRPRRAINSFKAAGYLITELDGLYRIFAGRIPCSIRRSPPSSRRRRKRTSPTSTPSRARTSSTWTAGSSPATRSTRSCGQIREIARRDREERYRREDLDRGRAVAPAAPPTPPTAAVVAALQAAIKDVYRQGGQADRASAAARSPPSSARRGFDAACWSKIDETAHQPNEYCIIDNMVGDAKVFAHLFLQD